jgi:hypothetical protein
MGHGKGSQEGENTFFAGVDKKACCYQQAFC